MKGLARLSMIFLAFFLLGMGGIGERPAGQLPEPDKNFEVTLTDSEGNKIRLSRFTIDGQTYFSGRLGEGKVTIPFEKIESITVKPAPGRVVEGHLVLKSGEKITLNSSQIKTYWGDAGFGIYQIPALNVRTVEFLTESEAAPKR